jgi:hypothetical protein
MYKHEAKYFKQTPHMSVELSAGGKVSSFIFNEKSTVKNSVDMLVIRNLAPEVGIEELK